MEQSLQFCPMFFSSFPFSCIKNCSKYNFPKFLCNIDLHSLILYRGFSTFHALIAAWASLYLLLFSDLFDKDSSNDLIVNRSSIISNMILGDIEIPFFIGLQFQIKRIRPRLVGSLFILGRVSMLLFGWFPQMRNRDSVLNALNGHSDHGRIEIKKILPKISFTLSLHMRSKLLLLSQRYTFRFGDMVQQMKIY